MMPRSTDGTDRSFYDWEEREVGAAAPEAAALGSRAGDDQLEPAERRLAEAGEGVAGRDSS